MLIRAESQAALRTQEKYSLSTECKAYSHCISKQRILHFYQGPDDSIIRLEVDKWQMIWWTSLRAVQDFIPALLKADDWVGIDKIKKHKALRMTFLGIKPYCIFILICFVNWFCRVTLSNHWINLRNCFNSTDGDVTDYSKHCDSLFSYISLRNYDSIYSS